MVGKHKFENQDSESILTDFSAESDVMVIVFAGMYGRVGALPAFEFVKTFLNYPVKKIFVRDLRRIWYQRGLIGGGETIAACRDYLANLIATQKPKTVLTLGGSMGATGALLYGCLLQVQGILAIAPVIRLNFLRRALFNEWHWLTIAHDQFRQSPRWLLQLPWMLGMMPHTMLDLKPLLQAYQSQIPTTIHYPHGHRSDYLHIQYIRDLSHLNIVAHDYNYHNLLPHLQKTQQLTPLIEAFIQKRTLPA